MSLDASSKESAQLNIDVMSLIDVNKNVSADNKLLRQCDCYGVMLYNIHYKIVLT